MSSTMRSFIRWSSLLPICLVLLLNINSFDFTNIESQVDSLKAMNIEQAAHGNLTRRNNSQFAMPIKRDRASLILKSLTALITTIAIALIIVRCLKDIKPNSKADQYRRLSEEENACSLMRYTPIYSPVAIHPAALRNGNRDIELQTITPMNTSDKPTCDVTREVKRTAEGYINVSLGDESNDLLKRPTAPKKKTMTKKMLQKAKEHRKAIIMAATGTAVAIVVIVALSIELRNQHNKNGKPHTEKFESDEYIRKDQYESLQSKYDSLKTEQNNYEELKSDYTALQEKHDALQAKFDTLQSNFDDQAQMQYTKEQYEEIETKYYQQREAYNDIINKYNDLSETYNNFTMDYNVLRNQYNLLFEQNKETKLAYQKAIKGDMFFVMQNLDFFRDIVKRGLNECNGKRPDAPFSGNTLQALKLRWDVMPQNHHIPFLKVDYLYKEMKHIGPDTGRTISYMKPILEKMATALDTIMHPTAFPPTPQPTA